MYKAIPKRFNLPSLLVPTLWLVPLIVAVLGTVTRSSDDVHHGFDIVAGGVLGLIFTLLVTLLLLKPHEVRQRAPLCAGVWTFTDTNTTLQADESNSDGAVSDSSKKSDVESGVELPLQGAGAGAAAANE